MTVGIRRDKGRDVWSAELSVESQDRGREKGRESEQAAHQLVQLAQSTCQLWYGLGSSSGRASKRGCCGNVASERRGW
jgi:hypothetical protein